jgi:parallel beta-helix repeat protein
MGERRERRTVSLMSVAGVKSQRLFMVLVLGVMVALVVVGLGSSAQAASKKGTSEKLTVRPGESIQEAVDAASAGDKIVVLPGVYRQSVVIKKNGVTLKGIKAVLKPPAGQGCQAYFLAPSGICVLGRVNPDSGEVLRYVKNVSVSGFTVRNFEGSGIVALGAKNASFFNNRALNNGEYGIAAFISTGTRIVSNVASGSEEAGLYVGDSPRANATIAGNDTYDNALGIFIRNARHGKIIGNQVHNNCIGVLFLADAPGPAGNFFVSHNKIVKNTRSCPAVEEEVPPLSGAGIVLSGARGVKIYANFIFGNVPSGPTAFKGGVVVVRGIGGTPPKNNVVIKNTILKNRPDIFWDESGSGNRFVANHCKTSKPSGLCKTKK